MFVETPNLLHKLAAQTHELRLPLVICELHFVRSTLCIFHKLISILPICHVINIYNSKNFRTDLLLKLNLKSKINNSIVDDYTFTV